MKKRVLFFPISHKRKHLIHKYWVHGPADRNSILVCFFATHKSLTGINFHATVLFVMIFSSRISLCGYEENAVVSWRRIGLLFYVQLDWKMWRAKSTPFSWINFQIKKSEKKPRAPHERMLLKWQQKIIIKECIKQY